MGGMFPRSFALALLFAISPVVSAATFTVDSDDGSGPGTLRQAILDANASPGRDEIRFAIDSLRLPPPFPPITDPVDIDGKIGSGRVRIDVPLFYEGTFIAFQFMPGSDGSVLRNLFMRRRGVSVADTYRVAWIEPSVTGVQILDVDHDTVVISYGDELHVERMTAAEGSLNLCGGSGAQLVNSTVRVVTLCGAVQVQLGVPGSGNAIGRLGVTEAATGSSVRGNTFTGAPYSQAMIEVGATSASEIVIAGNTLENRYFTHSVGMAIAGRARIQGNTIRGIRTGIVVTSPSVVIDANTIHDADTGVQVLFGGRAQITSNSMFDNGIDIDLGGDGPTPNDPAPDADAGPNHLQNHPVLTSARARSGTVTIEGMLTSDVGTTYLVQLFATEHARLETRTLVDSFDVTTDANGNAPFVRTVSASSARTRQITATATNRATGDTSEVSAAQAVGEEAIPTASTWALIVLSAALAAITLARLS